MPPTNEAQATSRGECGSCGSSDGNVHYDDGHAYCFVCEKFTPSPNQEGHTPMQNTVVNLPTAQATATLSQGQFSAIPDRSISLEAAKTYGVTQTDGKHIYPYYDINGNHVANKVRHVANKQFNAEGVMPHATLFGQQLFGRAGKFITICEGEVDAMSAYELLGSKWPVVSVKTGAQGSVRDVKSQYDFLNSFETIVICFDNDAPGIEAANKIAQIFEPMKCKIMDMKLKDANEYLKQNQREEFTRGWWAASPYTPAGIIRLCDHIDSLFEEDDNECDDDDDDDDNDDDDVVDDDDDDEHNNCHFKCFTT